MVEPKPDEIHIYFEGDKKLKPGFDEFFREIRDLGRLRRCKVLLIATEGQPFKDFSIALRSDLNSWNILLLDSEGPNTSRCAGYEWNKTHADSIFWMMQIMEAWFHADKDALVEYYGRDFKENALKQNPNVEDIPKSDLINGLKRATKDNRKGEYHKTRHAPDLLARIDPVKVRNSAPHCRRLFDTLIARLGVT